MEFVSKKARQSGTGLAELTARLTKRLADENANRNLVYSPLSLYAALALLAPGARGDTLDEILRILGARSRDELEEFISRMTEEAFQDRSDSGGPSIAFACGVWSDKTRPLKPAYHDAVVGTYKAEVRAVDFRQNMEEATQQINAWVAEVTRNLIRDVIAPGSMPQTTEVVLANAIYFKGKWILPFYERHTMNRLFHRLDGSTVDVPFMTNSCRHFVAVHDGFKVLKVQYKMSENLPYFQANKKPTQYSMCIFLPDAYDGLWSLVSEITSRPSFLHEHLPEREVKVDQFWVPKFKLSFSSDVTRILKYLGLLLPFSIEADLSGMVEDDGSGLLVDDVFHKAVIEVNEEGTEAAAVTMICLLPPGCAMTMPTPKVDFVADHPFAFFIVEEASGAIIFAGHVVDPSNGCN